MTASIERIQTAPHVPQEKVGILAILCPAFVADCLETIIEEIGMEAQEEFLEHGGEEFKRIPCMNTDKAWVAALTQMLENM